MPARKLPKHEAIRLAKSGKIDFDRTATNCNISYSGTDVEKRNRDHFKRVVSQIATDRSLEEATAIVLGCGAGYGAFYLRAYGFKGEIVGEDIDSNSVNVANILSAYFGHHDVQKVFITRGLKAARDIILNKIRTDSAPNPLDRMSFRVQDSTQPMNRDRPHDLIVCDNVHNEEVLGKNGKMTDMLLRMNDLSRTNTVLSYRFGDDPTRVAKLGFKPLKSSPVLYQRV